MKDEQAVRDRIKVMEYAKGLWLSPPLILYADSPLPVKVAPGEITDLPADGSHRLESMAPHASLESLNAELAALHWVLDGEGVT